MCWKWEIRILVSCKISFVLQRKSSVIQFLCLENIVLQNSVLGLLFKGIVKLEKSGSIY